MTKDIAEIQKLVSNPLDLNVIGDKQITGVIGDAPSQYSKSPSLWNAAFAALGVDAIYVPFDIGDLHLKHLTATFKNSSRFRGANVTVPHKRRVLDFLDQLDPAVERIQAVNTIVRTSEGRLIGYNTDGEGFVESILAQQPGQGESFVKSLKPANVLLLGAGGSARAVAFVIATLLDGGQLIICNRTVKHAQALAAEIRKTGSEAIAIGEEEIPVWARKVGLIINSTTKGQGGFRKLPDGRLTTLEPYSSLAPADPPGIMEAQYEGAEFQTRWLALAQSDIDANNRRSLNLCRLIPQNVRFYDLVYHPEETVFLRHARETGHMTMNGKAMIVCQAVIAFEKIFSRDLPEFRKGQEQLRRQLAELMHAAW